MNNIIYKASIARKNRTIIIIIIIIHNLRLPRSVGQPLASDKSYVYRIVDNTKAATSARALSAIQYARKRDAREQLLYIYIYIWQHVVSSSRSIGLKRIVREFCLPTNVQRWR